MSLKLTGQIGRSTDRTKYYATAKDEPPWGIYVETGFFDTVDEARARLVEILRCSVDLEWQEDDLT